MLAALLCSVLTAALFLLAGAPLALALRGPGEGIAALLHDALATGLSVVLVGMTVYSWLGPPTLSAGVLAYLVATGGILIRRGVGRLMPARRRRIPLWAGLAGLVVLIAIFGRLRYVNIIPWVGDMGGYVNWANQYARTGRLHAGFPPLMPVFLAVGSRLFGSAHTAANTPLLGAMLAFGLLRLFGQLRLAPIARLAVVLVLAIQVHAVWYSAFPASESLHAPLMIILCSQLLIAFRAHGGRRWAALIAIFLTSAALSLNRASVILLVIPLLVLLVTPLSARYAAQARAISYAAAAAVAGVFTGYLYGVQEIPLYYIQLQIKPMLPGRLFDLLTKLGLLRQSATLFAAIVGLLALIVLTGRVLGRPTRRRFRRFGQFPLLFAIAVVNVVALSALFLHRPSEVLDALGRMGWWLGILSVAALIQPRSSRGVAGLVAQFAATTASLFLAVEVTRLGRPVQHSIYLYWDRYLFSEYLPLTAVLAAIGISAMIRLEWSRRHLRIAEALVATVAVALCLGYVKVTGRTIRHTLYAGSYAFTAGLAHAVDRPAAPVFWSATSPSALAGIFPNSSYPFGMALSLSFGIPITNLNYAMPFAPDAVADSADVVSTLKTCGLGYVIEVIKASGRPLDQRIPAAGFTLSSQTVTGSFYIRDQSVSALWTKVTMSARVWRISGPGASSAAACRSGS